MFVEVFRPRQQQTGDQEHQPQTGPGIPQDINRGRVRKDQQGGTGQHRQKIKQAQRGPPQLMDGPQVPQSLIAGRQVRHRRVQSHRREGGQDRIQRQDQLIQP